jgi:predicted phage gp36 major capsid-like protein
MSQMHLAAPPILEALRADYRRIVESTEQELHKLEAGKQRLRDEELYRIRRRLLVTERDQVLQAFHQGALGRASQEKLLADIDARLLNLESGDEPARLSRESDGAADIS